MKVIAILTLMTIILLSLPTTRANAPLQTVPLVKLDKYMGTWYEIARYENKFQKK